MIKIIDTTDEKFRKIYTETLILKNKYEKKEQELLEIAPDICDWLNENLEINTALKLLHAKMKEDETKFAIDIHHLNLLTVAPEKIQEKYPNSDVYLIKSIDQTILYQCFGISVYIEKGYQNVPKNLIVVDFCILKDIYSPDFKIIGNLIN